MFERNPEDNGEYAKTNPPRQQTESDHKKTETLPALKKTEIV